MTGGTASEWAIGGAIVVDTAQNVIVVGGFSGSLTFGLGPGLKNSSPISVGFVVKLSSNGTVIWSRQFGTAFVAYVHEVAANKKGEVLVAGSFAGTADFGLGPVTSQGATDVFLAKLDPAGKTQWVRTHGSPVDDTVRGAGFDASGRAYVMTNFDGWNGSAKGANARHSIIVHDANGTELWRLETANAGDDGNTLAAVGASGDSVVTYGFNGINGAKLDLGGGELSAPGNVVYILAKYDAQGKHIWSASLGCQGPSAHDVRVLDDGAVLVTGAFLKQVGLGDTVVMSAGNWDAFAMVVEP